jgi:hypothetical protein
MTNPEHDLYDLRDSAQHILTELHVPMDRETIKAAVNDYNWQCLRLNLLGRSLERKYAALVHYFQENPTDTFRCIRIVNYINQLKKGGTLR